MIEVDARAGSKCVGPSLHDMEEGCEAAMFDSLLSVVGQLDAPQSDADLMEILERVSR